jgi:hypothetical protein
VKATLQNISLARWIIIVSVIASIGLGVYGFKLHAERVDLEVALKSKVPLLAIELQTLAKQHTSLMKQFDREGLGEQKDPQTYIRNIAANKEVQIGDTTVEAPAESENIRGVLDTRYGIKPSNRDRGYGRLNIANFLYKLESESRRMRVTRLRMEPEAKSVKPETRLESDSWRWEAEVTTRTKLDQPAPVKK